VAKNQRARGKVYPGPKKGSAMRNDNTRTVSGKDQGVRVLSSQDAAYVGRPGFKGTVPGPVDGKARVKILKQHDPSKGLSQPGADKITTTDVDLVGAQNPTILSAAGVQKAFSTGKKTISTGQPTGSRKSLPVNSNKPGRVTRPRSR